LNSTYAGLTFSVFGGVVDESRVSRDVSAMGLSPVVSDRLSFPEERGDPARGLVSEPGSCT
jgi:hypothetical protein